MILKALPGVLSPKASTAERESLPMRDELVTCALGTWMLAGIYLDGWAHRNRDLQDSITTPWHAIFYAGYVAFASWIAWVVIRRLRAGRRGLDAVPVGYGVGLIGIASFTVGGLGDQIWHLSLGVEQDLNAFQSPTHWLLAIGMFLMASCPLRAGWSTPGPVAPRLKEFAPTLWSLVLTVAMFFFAFNYMSFFIADSPTIDAGAFAASLGRDADDLLAISLNERLRILGLLMISITSIALVASILFAQRRWKLPPGSVTAVFVLTAVADNVVWEFRFGWVIVAALVGGIVGDWFIQRHDPRPSNLTAWRLFPVVVLLPMWLAYYAILFVGYDMNWPAEMWTGSMIMAVLHCTLLTFLMRPLDNPLPGGDR
ncbi:MAG TPA: hypothetical protein VMY78_13545 [Solirubrobacteraceae bacterium]|nr:hypothetical protein [Solirubrobacteraceae bacterium]